MKKAVLFLIATGLLWLPSIQSFDQFFNAEELSRLEKYSEQARRRGEALNQLMEDVRNKEIEEQLQQVNRFFNQFQYREDIDQWREKDYWMTPQEFIGTQQGDCEDFVIAKFFVLRQLGVPDKRLYLTYVKALKQNVAHMVLSYFETPGSIPLILDNYNPQILKGNQRMDLLPVYSFNAESLFLTNASAGLGRSLPTDKIKNSKWKKLLANLRKDKP